MCACVRVYEITAVVVVTTSSIVISEQRENIVLEKRRDRVREAGRERKVMK